MRGSPAFDGPVRAIRCAKRIRDAVWSLGIETRAGLQAASASGLMTRSRAAPSIRGRASWLRRGWVRVSLVKGVSSRSRDRVMTAGQDWMAETGLFAIGCRLGYA